MPTHIPLREFALGIFFVAITAFVHSKSYEDERIAEAEAQERMLSHYVGIVAQCLDGRADILWQEPHSGNEMSTQCRTVTMGRMK